MLKFHQFKYLLFHLNSNKSLFLLPFTIYSRISSNPSLNNVSMISSYSGNTTASVILGHGRQQSQHLENVIHVHNVHELKTTKTQIDVVHPFSVCFTPISFVFLDIHLLLVPEA